MKHLGFVLLMLCSLQSIAQTFKPSPAPMGGYAVIKGHVTNPAQRFWELVLNGFLDQKLAAIPIDANGNFSKTVKVEGDAMEMLIIPTRRTLSVMSKDTITMTWDDQRAPQTFTIAANNRFRNSSLRMQNQLDSAFFEPYQNLQASVYNNQLTDVEKFTAINNLYNREIEMLSKDDVLWGYENIGVDVYFKYALLMHRRTLLPGYNLQINKPNANTPKLFILNTRWPYATESESWFRSSNSYRNFLYDYVRFSTPIKVTMIDGTPEQAKLKTAPSHNNLPLKTYQAGMNVLSINEIRDWYGTRIVMDNFTSQDFNQSTGVYNDFITKVKNPRYADTLKQFYQNMKRLKPGMPAPGFTLKDKNGRMVSLSQFKGKTVYIDFWGVNCGPCLYDIKNSIPALHEKYKDKNVVFLNICVDSDERTWQNSLKELNLHGTNLVATGWTQHPAVKAYNITGIPHYVLIDANGNIVNNNSPGPSMGPQLYNELDKLVR